MIDCFVIGNCQTRALAYYLNYFSNEIHAQSIELHTINFENLQSINKLKNKLLENKDVIIITQNIFNKKFSFFDTDYLKNNTKGNLYTITNFRFDGYMPDAYYINTIDNKRLQSAIGDYNSKIIFESYINNIDEKECIKKFNENTYYEKCYFNVWDESKQELLNRDNTIDIPFTNEFFNFCNEFQTMYTINHPKAFIFKEYAKKILQHLNIKKILTNDVVTFDDLACGPQIAIFEELTKKFKLNYICEKRYKKSAYTHYMDIHDYVICTYKKYNEQAIDIKQMIYKDDIIADFIFKLYSHYLGRFPEDDTFNKRYNILKKENMSPQSMCLMMSEIYNSDEAKKYRLKELK